MKDAVSLVQQRHEVLQTLATSPKSKPEIVDATPNARSTVDRAIGELVDAELVERHDSGYRLTTAGQWMVAAYQEYREAAAQYYDVREAISGAHPDERLPALLFDGASVTISNADAPTTAIASGLSELDAADAVYTTCPFLLDVYDRYVHEVVIDHDVAFEVIVTPSVIETIEAEYADRWAEVLETGLVTAYVSDRLSRYSIHVAEGVESARDGSEVGVTFRDDRGIHQIINDTPAAVEWGRERYESARAGAEKVYPTTD